MRYLDKTIQEIHELLKNKKIKPIDLVEESFERIENNKELNAYITLNKEEAITKAKELENKEVDNLLFGLPIAIKDNIVTTSQIANEINEITNSQEEKINDIESNVIEVKDNTKQTLNNIIQSAKEDKSLKINNCYLIMFLSLIIILMLFLSK